MIDLRQGDCLEVLKQLDADSIDSIVTDPPYGLSFMGRKWDYDVPSVEIWQQCLRVLKPGGHLLAFAGTRTQHRMCVNIEDAGFEIRDMIAWVYGSGFPKSMDVGKAIDKKANERPVFDAIRAHIRHWRDLNGYDNKGLNEAVSSAVKGCGMARHWTSEVGTQHAIPSKDQWLKLKSVLGWPDCDFDALYESIKDGADRPVISEQRGTTLAVAPGQGIDRIAANLQITAPATPEAQQWEGWGTALKPALEPITVARKPFKGTVANNVLTHGTGAINIDGCRVGDEVLPGQMAGQAQIGTFERRDMYTPERTGRWPANLIHDGSDEVTQMFPSPHGAGHKCEARWGGKGDTNAYGTYGGENVGGHRYGDSGSAARFFYCSKASKKDRNSGLDGVVSVIIEPYACADAWGNGDQQVKLLVDTAQSPPRVTAAFGAPSKSVIEWNTMLFGNWSTVQSPTVLTSTTKTATNSTTHLKILSCFQSLLTSENIQDANLETGNGSSPAVSVENGVLSSIITSEKMASVLGVEPATCPMQWRINVKDATSTHPTVKPTDLMAYLCRLVTPPGGVVLDPFMGSGSTGKAAIREGFRFIGIEREAEYYAIAQQRVQVVEDPQAKLDLAV